MAIEEIDAALVGEATSVMNATASYAASSAWSAEAMSSMGGTVSYAATSSWLGEATAGLNATAVYGASASWLGEANSTLSATGVYAGAALMPGVSTVLADLDIFDEESLDLVGDSTFAATASLVATLTSAFVGNANMVFDPAGITITNFARGPQIPATARPISVPTIRIVPPAPPPPSYSVGSPPTRGRRREG